ncbi:regucalcin [Cephus cinctus]|uniref:Regucalcin n=1 Tax=Cephus cinctus TaxID=211228 RepID=A0AAJ7RNF0_CEPCN|nr:regucalcin [Cephus cinctus]
MAIRNLRVFALLMVAILGSVHGLKGKRQTKYIVNQVTEPVQHAEGPHWDYRSETLFFVDIHEQKIYRLNSRAKSLTYTYIANGPVGVAIPVEDSPDQLVAGAGTDFVLVTWDATNNDTNPTINVLTKVDTDRTDTRWNDGKVDSSGRFWGGTMGPEINGVITLNRGSLYRITNELKPEKMVSPVSISNGEAWNIQDNKFYYIDSPTRQIVSYSFDSYKGIISNKTIAFDLKSNNIIGTPDGMTIDVNGNLWVALYGGNHVINVNPRTGKLLRAIKIPAEQVTSVAFGGPLLDILYVTTSRIGLNESQLLSQPKAGSVFAVKNLGIQGLPANLFELTRA